ncbi:hypothetical protein GOBAR_DD28404 [Gossypium barbadense]|nr:hypothetical protein GOBAR_DD28404 [Gossypium barbadense]
MEISNEVETYAWMENDNHNEDADIKEYHLDPSSKYEDFNDVVSFNPTYCVNKYKMSFASFVGVNHHGQLIFLECALVSPEDGGAFRWLFKLGYLLYETFNLIGF